MSSILKGIVLVAMWAGIMTMQFNLDLDMSATRNLKNGLEIAAHDASLSINTTELGRGRIVFDQSDATDQFYLTLRENLKLDSSLEPLSNSFFDNPINIVHLEYIDGSSGIEFPFNYYNADYDILETVSGPSIVVVAETRSPRFFRGDSMLIRQAVVYEYIVR